VSHFLFVGYKDSNYSLINERLSSSFFSNVLKERKKAKMFMGTPSLCWDMKK